MSSVVWAFASAPFSADDLSLHNIVFAITVFSIADRVSGSNVPAVVLDEFLFASSDRTNFTHILSIIVFVLCSSRLWSRNLLLDLSLPNDLEILFAGRQDNRRRSRCFLDDNLLRLWRTLTDNNWLWRWFRTIVVLGLALISLELVWFLSAFCCPLLNSHDVGLPNVLFRLPRPSRTTVPRTVLWLAPVPFVNHGPGTLALSLGFADGFALDISLAGEG